MTDNNSIDNKSVDNHDAKTLNSKVLDEGGSNSTIDATEENTERSDKNSHANIDSNKKSDNVVKSGVYENSEKNPELETRSDTKSENKVEDRVKNKIEKKILSLKVDSQSIGKVNEITSNLSSGFGSGIGSNLNKSVSRNVSGVVRQNFAHGKSRQVQIEVKGKKKFGIKASDDLSSDSSKDKLKSFNGDINELKRIFPNLTKSEIELRMNLVKRMGDSDSEKVKQSAKNVKGSFHDNAHNGDSSNNLMSDVNSVNVIKGSVDNDGFVSGSDGIDGANVGSISEPAAFTSASGEGGRAAAGTSDTSTKSNFNSDSDSTSTSHSKSFKVNKVDKKSKSQLSDEEKLPVKKKGKVSTGFKTDKIKGYNIYDDDLDDLDSFVDIIDIDEDDELIEGEDEKHSGNSGNLSKLGKKNSSNKDGLNKNSLNNTGAVNKFKLNSRLATKFDVDKKSLNANLNENGSNDTSGAFAKSGINAAKKEKRKIQNKSIMISSAGLILSDLAHRLSVSTGEVERIAEDLGVELSDKKLSNKKLSKEVAELIAQHFGYEVIMDTIDGILHDSKSRDYTRPPVVVVMGHVDHGKTSLLDAMRKSNVVSGEKGGITQHIGAYSIVTQSQDQITFIDTPGHALFKDMRARGVNFTDIAILVVAADDGVKEQTVEAITHAQSVNMPIVVAINKIDREGSDVERVRRELANYNVIVESYGGDVMEVQVSAKNGSGIVELQNAILLQSQTMDLKTYVNGRAHGFVIESRVDKGKGPVATILLRDGTLNSKDIFVCGDSFGKVRLMTNDMGKNVKVAGPSSVVVVSGFDELPVAGEKFSVVRDEKDAKTVIESRITNKIDEVVDEVDPFAALKNQNKKELFFVVKADVAGSIDAIKFGLESLSSEEVKVTVIKAEVGNISESDLSIAHLSNAIVVGFNVKSNLSRVNKEYEKVPVRYYNIIYKLIDDVVDLVSENKEQKFNHIFIGLAEVVKVFDMKDDTGKFRVAGCIVRKGEMRKASKVKVLRKEVVVFDMGDMRSLQIRRIDSDIVPEKEECGIVIKKFMNTEVGDFIECFDMEKVKD